MPCSIRVEVSGSAGVRLSPGDGDRPDLPGDDVRAERGRAAHRDVGDAGQDILVEWSAALVGDQVQVDVVLLLDQRCQDQPLAGAQHAKADLARPLLRVGDGVGEGLVGPVGMGHDRLRRLADLHDVEQVGILVRQAGREGRIEDVAVESDHPGLAVGDRLGRDRRAHRAGAAGLAARLMTFQPVVSISLAWMMRATGSVEPPGGKGTMILSWPLGHSPRALAPARSPERAFVSAVVPASTRRGGGRLVRLYSSLDTLFAFLESPYTSGLRHGEA